MWVSRALLAVLLSAPYGLIAYVLPAIAKQGPVLRVRMAVPAFTVGQVYFDVGSGFREQDSSSLHVAGGMRNYDFPLAGGTLRGLRLDPGTTGGRYVVRAADILDVERHIVASLKLSSASSLYQLRIIPDDGTDLILDSAAGSADPHFVLDVPQPLVLETYSRSNAQLVGIMVVAWMVALAFVLAAERVFTRLARPVERLRRAWSRLQLSTTGTLLLVSIVATTASTYPLLFAGRTLVSPANGSVNLLFDFPPSVPGFEGQEVEDTRGTDVGAIMWAFLPYSKMQRDAVLRGELPLWLRYNGAGRSLWGQGQSFLLDPLHWLTFVRANPAVGWDLKYVAHRFMFSFGVGVAALLATGALIPAAVAAFVAPFAGLYTFRFSHPAAFTVSYAPWILVGWFLIAQSTAWRPRWRGSLVLSIASVLTLVASPPKESLIMLVACHGIGALSASWRTLPMDQRARGLLAGGVGAVIAALVSAPHWLVFIDTLREARTGYDVPSVYFAGADSALAFVFGNLTPGALQPGLQPIAVALALCGLAAPRFLRRRPELGACAIGAVALTAVAFGAIPASLLVHVPLVGNIVHFGDVVTTALMVPTLILTAGGAWSVYRAARVSGVVLALLIVGIDQILLAMTAGRLVFERFDQWVAACVLLVALCVPYTIAAIRRHVGRALPVLCTSVSIVVVTALGGLQLPTGQPLIDQLLPQPVPRSDLARQSPEIEQARRRMRGPFRAIGVGTLLLPGTQGLYGLEGIGGPDALEIGTYEDLLDAGGMDRLWGWLTLVNADHLDRAGALLDMLNVRLLLTRQGQVPPGLAKASDDADPLLDTAIRPQAWPRAFFVDGVRTYAHPADLLQTVRDTRTPFAAVAEDDLLSRRSTNKLSKREQMYIPAVNYRLTTNATQFQVSTTSPGVAVLTETYMRDDFRATLNGHPVPYFRVNHAFKGVVIPSAGVWEVRFEYRPRHWSLAWICAAAGATLAGLVAWSSRRAARSPNLHQAQVKS